MTEAVIQPAGDLPPDALAHLVAESEQEDCRFVRRLADDIRPNGVCLDTRRKRRA